MSFPQLKVVQFPVSDFSKLVSKFFFSHGSDKGNCNTGSLRSPVDWLGRYIEPNKEKTWDKFTVRKNLGISSDFVKPPVLYKMLVSEKEN